MAKRDWATGKEAWEVPSRIPVFETVEEEAEFWDTHDSAEFEDELEPVEEEIRFVVVQPHRRGISLQFDEETMTALTERAARERTDPGGLIYQWVIERLKAS